MAAAMGSFDEWLTEKLQSLSPEFDTDVFVSYIIGIIETDSASEETTESIEEILSQVLGEEESRDACREIMTQWGQYHTDAAAAAALAVKKDAGDKLSELMEKQTLATVKETKRTMEEEERKRAILAQYAQVSEGEGSDEEGEETAAAASSKGKGDSANTLMERNLNAASVTEAQQAQREQSRQEHERKKEKDKADREAQRQKQQQRKDAEKKRTQKGERRR